MEGAPIGRDLTPFRVISPFSASSTPFSLDQRHTRATLLSMRMRSFGSLPSFSGFLNGFSMAKTIAYGVAADWGRSLSEGQRNRDKVAAYARQSGIEQALIAHGILPVRLMRELGRKTQWLVPPTHQPVSQATHYRPAAKAVLPSLPRIKQSRNVEPTWRPHPAATKASGGLRGSTATRWRL